MDIKKVLLIVAFLLASCSLWKQDTSSYDPQQPCAYIENTIELYHVDDDRISGPYMVIDCLQLSNITDWPTPETSGETVEVIGTDIRHKGVARPAENIVIQDVDWLNVIIQHEQIRPYALNLQIVPTSNIIVNPSFEEGQFPWHFHSDIGATFTLDEPGYTDNYAANISVPAEDSNLQLYQINLPLEPITQYRLVFVAQSNTGHDLSVHLLKHESPYTNYGLRQDFDLTTSWQEFSIDFETTGFGVSVLDARLRFWFSSYATGGDLYQIDNVILSKIVSATETPIPPSSTPIDTLEPPTETPTDTPLPPTVTFTPTPTSTDTPPPIHDHQEIFDRLDAIETQQVQTSEQFTDLEQRIRTLEILVRQISDLIRTILGE